MQHQTKLKIITSLIVLGLLLPSCSAGMANTASPPSDTPAADPTQPKASKTMAVLSPTPTPEPTITPTATLPPPTPTLQWIYNEPGLVTAPILLYHQIDGDAYNSRYQVPIENFRAQMEAIQELGYTPISISLLLDALLTGAELPPKPIVITFDDGHHTVYEQAFPIMQEFGYPGVFYIVANRIYNSPDFVTIDQLKEMIAAGWEIGSHSYSHADLTLDHSIAPKEIGQSKADLEAALGVRVVTFAYPYGKIDSFTAQKVSDYTYRAGMGLGTRKVHKLSDWLYLERIEIYGEYTLEQFIDLLTKE